MQPTLPARRRHDIDALRALAFGLLILYHLGMYYVAGWPWHLKAPTRPSGCAGRCSS